MAYGTASFSPNGLYRYRLTRAWLGGQGEILFILLNPSTANADQDDPTVRRCCTYAQRWGYQRLTIVNIFAYRTPYPSVLRLAIDPVGEENDCWIARLATKANEVLVGWGNHGTYHNRGREVYSLLQEAGVQPVCLGQTKGGEPFHPLHRQRGHRDTRFPYLGGH
jgi:hypothetical protein